MPGTAWRMEVHQNTGVWLLVSDPAATLPGLAAHPCPGTYDQGTPTLPAPAQALRSELMEVTEWVIHHPSSALWKQCNFQAFLDHKRQLPGCPQDQLSPLGKAHDQSPSRVDSASWTTSSLVHCLYLRRGPTSSSLRGPCF